jgi:alcohol dehydrogenase (cytochrome c)
MGTADNYLVALDQKTGKEVWKVNVDDSRQCGCGISSAPLIVKDKVVIGGNGGDNAHRGYLTAFYARTGRLAWRWYVIPGPGEKGNETWKGDSWKFGGGSPWLTGSFDPDLNLVYWGTGNAAPDFYDADRVPAGADKTRDVNLYTGSVVALDADTGRLRWHYQEVPADIWDYDSSYEVLLMDREIRGALRKLALHLNKGGLATVLDRASGEFLGVFSIPEVRTWISGVTEDGKLLGRKEPKVGQTVTFCPSWIGAKSWNSMAYSPRTGFIYTPTIELCNDVIANDAKPQEGRSYFNGTGPTTLPPGRTTYAHLDAWDPVSGKRAWSMPYPTLLLASVLATAGDLVFIGDPEGNFVAHDARNGARLWSFQNGAGHRGATVSYAVNGRQYIAVTTGWQQNIAGGTALNLFPGQQFRSGSTVVVFALPDGSR